MVFVILALVARAARVNNVAKKSMKRQEKTL